MSKQISRKWLFIALFFILVAIISIIFNVIFLSKSHHIKTAAELSGIDFTSEEIDLMKDDVEDNLKSYTSMRKYTLQNSTPPSLYFDPFPPGFKLEKEPYPALDLELPQIERPENLEDLAFATVPQLAALIKTRQVTSTELTQMYLARLKKYDPKLKCVITLTEELALKQAARADEEIAAGNYRGPLHGIPWGAKDLLATKDIKTTWGSMPYQHQAIDHDAAVVKKLEEAGAVLVAKLSLGALAWGDVWFGGQTRNPWDTEQGSSGSSAGPASATSAGLVGFSIGTETWGSIVSPANRCGVTGLRPTFGRVSRDGAMALSWSMDKIGPICRSVEGCALVFNAIYGPDGQDLTIKDAPFTWPADIDIKKLRVGYVKKAFDAEYENKKNDQAVLETFKKMGVQLIEMDLPEFPVDSISFILSAEAAAAFDELTRSGKDDMLVRQVRHAWPNVFRHSRLIPAVEYIQANRHRTMVQAEMVKLFQKVDVYICPTYGGNNLLLTNLTGHPSVVVPNGFDKKNHPTSITFMGDLFDEEAVLAVARAFQNATLFHMKHPQL